LSSPTISNTSKHRKPGSVSRSNASREVATPEAPPTLVH
jgi:hypothetical protein